MSQKHFTKVKSYLYRKWRKSTRYKDFVVCLNDKEIHEAANIAQKRHEEHTYLNHNSNYQRELLGSLGEYAALKWFKNNEYIINFDLYEDNIIATDYEDKGDGDIIFDGKSLSIEIKTTVKPMNSKLIIPKNQYNKTKAELFVLVCQLDESKYCIKGFANKEMLKHDLSLKRPGYSICEANLCKNVDDLLQCNV